MRFKIIALMITGFLLAIAGGIGTYLYTRALEEELASLRVSLDAFGETSSIPVPRRDIALGELLAPSDFSLVKLPASYIPTRVSRAIPPSKEGEGLVALDDLNEGELLFNGDVAPAGESPYLGLRPAPDSKIFVVTPHNLGKLAPALTEGSRIDLVFTRSLGSGQTETRLLGTGLKVRALPENRENAGKAPSPLAGTLLVEGDLDTAMLSLIAEDRGQFHILISDGLRNLNARETVVSARDLEDLPLVVRQEAGGTGSSSIIAQVTGDAGGRGKCVTAVIRGGARSTAEVPC